MSELRECPYIKKYLALEWMSDTQPMPDGSKVFATKEECLAFVQGHPHFKEFPDVRWTIVTVYDTSPTESALRKRVGELEELLKTAEDVLSNEDSNDQFRLETAGLIRAKLGINPACKTKSLERFGVFLPAPPETEA